MSEHPSKRVKREPESTEESVGMRAFIGSLDGFSGILKHRFTDFVVNEIQEDVVHLNSLEIPSVPPKVTEQVDEVQGWDALAHLLNDETILGLKKLLESGTSCLSNPIEAKLDRTAIHTTVRTYFGSRIDTKTASDNQIQFFKASKNAKRREAIDYASLGGEYLHFTLYKENKDTMQAIDAIAKAVKRPVKTFSYAGTKDRRAVTVQRVSAHKMSPETLIGTRKFLQFIRVGNFSYHTDAIKLGDLKGNQFQIVLRDVVGEKDTIGLALSSLRDNGFINYYGMQRFGTRAVPTSTIGKALLSSKWEEAVDLIVGLHGDYTGDELAARTAWTETKDVSKALSLFPRYCLAERCILTVFQKNKSNDKSHDYYNGIRGISHSLRSMYIHAYQSLVWNEMTSIRLTKHGLKPIAGDLVLLEDVPEIDLDADEVVDIEPTESKEKTVAKVLVLTADNAQDYTIFDIVLPLPGHAITYPDNDMLQSYKDFMAQDGFDPLDMKSKQYDLNLPGSYRKMVHKPLDLTWNWIRYDEPDQQLSRTDLDELKKSPLIESSTLENAKTALILKMSLGVSQYATMALREAMKSGS